MVGLLLIWGTACGGVPACVDLPEACTPEYEPTFDNVWANTLEGSCALSGCHGEGASRGGLSLGSDPQGAFDALVQGGWVVAGDPECSPLQVQLDLGSMPPGAPLSALEQCAVYTWIANGAEP